MNTSQSGKSDRPVRRIIGVTPVHNRKGLTIDCLRTIFQMDLYGVDLHIIVVDDGSTDGTSDAIRSAFPEVEIIKGDGNLHYTAGTNLGLRAALLRQPDYILIFNDDSRFPEPCLRRMLDCAEAHGNSVIGPLLLNWNRPADIFQVAPVWRTLYGGWRHWTRQRVDTVPERPFPVELIVGNCMLIPVAALEAVGLMREELPKYGDGELAVRMRRAGYRLLIEPRARLLCEPNAVAPKLRNMPLAQLWYTLFVRVKAQNNLRELFRLNWYSAPSRARGVFASVIYVLRAAARRLGLDRNWPGNLPETPIVEWAHPLDPEPAPVSHIVGPILHAWPYKEWGGVQIYFLALAQGARALGFDIRILMPAATSEDFCTTLSKAGVNVELMDSHYDLDPALSLRRRIQRRLRNWRTERELAARLARQSPPPCVVHIDVAPWTSARLLRRLLARSPVFMTIHTPLAKVGAARWVLWRWRLRSFLAHPRSRLFVTNGAARASLTRYVTPDSLDRVEFCPSCFVKENIEMAAVNSMPRSDLEARLGLAPNRRRVVVGAQFIERKGCRVFIEAAARLNASGEDIDFIWIAPSQPDARLLKIIEDSELGLSFTLRTQAEIGGTPQAYLTAVAGLSDIFVLPSLVEGLPLALVEAMALGKACLATRINAVPELIRHGVTGWLVPPSDAPSLAEAIRVLMSDEQLRLRLGMAARADVFVRYERSVATRATMAAYRAAAAG